jgi:hypothetical protein
MRSAFGLSIPFLLVRLIPLSSPPARLVSSILCDSYSVLLSFFNSHPRISPSSLLCPPSLLALLLCSSCLSLLDFLYLDRGTPLILFLSIHLPCHG